MGFYGEHILPRLVNAACGMKTVEPLRRRVCEGLAGDVIEIGFGSGLNVPFYPSEIARVAAVEPADLGWKLAEKRLMETRIQVQRSGLDGQSLPFQIIPLTLPYPRGRCAPSLMSPLPCVSCGASSSPERACILSNTAWRRTSLCVAGNNASIRSRSGSSADAASPVR
jgi:hypothetical protein